MKLRILIIALLAMPTFASAQKAGQERDYTTAVLWQQTSGEYRALAFQAYNFARLSLNNALGQQQNDKRNCVIVDADETIIDNSAFQGYEIKKGKSYDPADWATWTAKSLADTVPGALSFLQYAASKNVEVFYLTNRDETDRTGTIRNLKKLGFPYIDEAHLLLKDNTSDKEPRRQKILEKYNVLLLCGDNLSDFSNVFYREGKDTKEEVDAAKALFGTKFIVLPNPMYGDWEKPLYTGDKPDEAEKGRQRLKRLKSFLDT